MRFVSKSINTDFKRFTKIAPVNGPDEDILYTYLKNAIKKGFLNF